MIHRGTFIVSTSGRSLYDITSEVSRVVDTASVHERAGSGGAESGGPGSERFYDGLATIWIHHTSASLIVCENADDSVRRDLEAFAARLVRDGDPMFTHVAEGDDDMPAHVRSVLTQTSIGVPVIDGRLALGTWQGLYLWEHRFAPHQRQVTVMIVA